MSLTNINETFIATNSQIKACKLKLPELKTKERTSNTNYSHSRNHLLLTDNQKYLEKSTATASIDFECSQDNTEKNKTKKKVTFSHIEIIDFIPQTQNNFRKQSTRKNNTTTTCGCIVY